MNGEWVWIWMVKNRITVLLAVVLLVLTVSSSNFWTPLNLQNATVAVSIDGPMVVGMTIVMIGGGFDLSVGSVMALTGVLAIDRQTWGLANATVVAFLAAGLVGVVNGLLVTKIGINPFIATLGTMVAVRGLAMTYADGQPLANTDLVFTEIGRGKVGLMPIPGAIFLVVLFFGHFILTRTVLGRDVFAVGGNEEAARSCGIRTTRVKMIAYVLCSLMAGLSGLMLAARLSTGSPIVGEEAALSVIAAVLLGGTSLTGGVGSVSGSVQGLVLVGVVSNGLNLLDVPAYYQQIGKGILLITAVVGDHLCALSPKRTPKPNLES